MSGYQALGCPEERPQHRRRSEEKIVPGVLASRWKRQHQPAAKKRLAVISPSFSPQALPSTPPRTRCLPSFVFTSPQRNQQNNGKTSEGLRMCFKPTLKEKGTNTVAIQFPLILNCTEFFFPPKKTLSLRLTSTTK